MESLNAIEKRIDNLNRILGPFNENEGRNENLTDALISANTLIGSALSGREKVVEAAKRSDELEKYLDPSFIDDLSSIKSKEVYVHTIAPELAENFEMLEEIQKLESTLGAEYFRNIPDVTEKIKEMNVVTSDQATKNDLLEESLILAMQRYSEIQDGIKTSLKVMNDRLDRIDEKLKQRKKIDEDV